MKVDNLMLFFRDQADEADVDGIDDQLCIPAKNLVGISPASDTTLTLTFESVKNNTNSHNEMVAHDTVVLTVQEGDLFEAMEGILQAINSNPHHDGFLVIADDCATTDSATSALADLTIATEYVHPSILGVASITCKAATYSARMPDFGIGNAEPTNISATALSVNTHYQSIAAATAMTIPSAAAGKAGDWITVFYDTACAGNTHTYTTTTDTAFALGSTITTTGGTHTARIPRSDIAVAADNQVNIVGNANGDGGLGTFVKFVNLTGAAQGWAVQAYVTHQADGTANGTSGFSAV